MTENLVLELARRADGFLTPWTPEIDQLRWSGLVTTQDVGDGFVIVKAFQRPRQRLANHKWIWPQDRVSA